MYAFKLLVGTIVHSDLQPKDRAVPVPPEIRPRAHKENTASVVRPPSFETSCIYIHSTCNMYQKLGKLQFDSSEKVPNA